MKFRKKPVVIEAEQYTPGILTAFIHDACCMVNHCIFRDELHIHTLEGMMRVSPGDYVIKGIKGEFYPCKEDIFEATYEPVGEPVPA